MSSSRRSGFLLFITTLIAACGGGDSSGVGSPPPPAAEPPPVVAPPPVTLDSISIVPSAPSLAVDETLTLKAIGAYSDSSSADVSDDVTWSTTSAVIALSSSGDVTGLAKGSATVAARHANGSEASYVLGVDPHPDSPVAISDAAWDDTAVRHVLHTFAYGSRATDDQIAAWSDLPPDQAIEQILTFEPNNPLLAPPGTRQLPPRLADLQTLLGGDEDNPMRWDRRRFFATLNTDAAGNTSSFSRRNLQRTWIHAATSGGSNAFLHRTAFFLSNYQMALRASVATPGILRSYYDQFIDDLIARESMTDIITTAAKSAAVAKRYGHNDNRFNNANGDFSGNDDFAREYFQLFFRLLGETEDVRYHENVTIKNNSRLLTGFAVDRRPNAYGSVSLQDRLVAPIDFSDHFDGEGHYRRNATRHHAACLEILREQICGPTGAAKLDALGPVVRDHPEVLANLPVYIVSHFADDRIDAEEARVIRRAWIEAGDDLLEFLRSYAISTVFHSPARTKQLSTFDRNLILLSRILVDDDEVYLGRELTDSVIAPMERQGGTVFEPAKAVFGGQTGAEAALNPGILKDAFETSLGTAGVFAKLETTYAPQPGEAAAASWQKDWGKVVPDHDKSASTIGHWLWQRLVADNGENFDAVAEAQVLSFLARGSDFGTVAADVTGLPSTAHYTVGDIAGSAELTALIDDLGSEPLELWSADPDTRRDANRRMNLAVNFIAVLPFAFAIEGS